MTKNMEWLDSYTSLNLTTLGWCIDLSICASFIICFKRCLFLLFFDIILLCLYFNRHILIASLVNHLQHSAIRSFPTNFNQFKNLAKQGVSDIGRSVFASYIRSQICLNLGVELVMGGSGLWDAFMRLQHLILEYVISKYNMSKIISRAKLN